MVLLLRANILPPSRCNMRQLLLPNKKRRATAAFTHVSPPSVVVGSAERHANAVLSASTAAVNRLSLKHLSLAFKRMETNECIIILFVTLLPIISSYLVSCRRITA